MMTLMDRYIGSIVAVSIFSVLLLLLVLLGFFELLEQLDEVRGGYTTQRAFAYVGLILPRYSYELFPIATLLGSLIGMGSLAANSELTALRAAGVSISRIVGAILKVGMLLLLLVILIGEYLAPLAESEAQRIKMQAVSDQVTLKTRYGFWSRSGDSFVNIRNIISSTSLADIHIYDYDEHQVLRRALHADLARYEDNRWLLEQVSQSEFREDQIIASTTQSLEWASLLEPSVLDVVSVNPQMLTAWDLWRFIQYLQQNGQDSTSYEVAFWNKVVSPLVTLVMLFLSIPFVFGSLRTIGIGERIFTGAIIGIVFYLMNRAFSHIAVVYGMSPLFAAVFPALLFFTVSLWFFRRVH